MDLVLMLTSREANKVLTKTPTTSSSKTKIKTFVLRLKTTTVKRVKNNFIFQ